MRWITLYSRSGSEIINLSKKLNREPDLILTNKKDFNNSLIPKEKTIYIDNSIKLFNKYLKQDDLITLHGYLRIIPEEICKNYNIINGHPGLINRYPELKGKDPQERSLNYPYIGSVLHKVIKDVDEGNIISYKEIKNNCINIDCIYKTLSKVSLQLWYEFLKEKLNVNSN